MKKKGLLTALLAALMVCTLLCVPTAASASTGLIETAGGGTLNFYKQDGGNMPLKSYDFENDITTGIDKNWGTHSHETQNAITGSGSLKTEANDTGYPQLMFAVSRNTKTAGRYYVEFDVKPQTVNAILIGIAVNSAAGAADHYLTEFGASVTYTGDVATSMTAISGSAAGGYGAPADKYENVNITDKGDGVFHCYFEYVLSGNECDSTEFTPIIQFKQRTADLANNSVIWDNIAYGQVTPDKYFTVDWDVSYDDIQPNGAPWDQQPVWANSGDYVHKSSLDPDGYALQINVPASNNNTVGGLTQAAGADNKLIKAAGLNYVQYDIKVEDCTEVNIWSNGNADGDPETPGFYTAVLYNGTSWRSEGAIESFQSESLGFGKYRLSYYVNMAENVVNKNFQINTTSANGGKIYIDNFIVAHEDYAPVATNASVNMTSRADVEITVYDKDKAFTSLTVKGESSAVDSAKYIYDEKNGKLTVGRELFAAENVTFVIATEGGSCECTVTVVDDRPEIAAVTPSAAITKEYDGTVAADITGLTFTPVGVDADDEVTVTVTAAEFASKDVNATAEVIVTAELSGADEGYYKLAETVTTGGSITPKALTVSAPTVTKTKVYDATVTAQATAGTLTGVLEGDEVTVTASAVFNSANVTEANKITVTYALEGEDAANYTVPEAVEITEGVAVTKKAITVTAENKSKTVGETDPALTYTVDGLLGSDALTGTLTRAEGETVGEYDIALGTLSAGGNYEITFTGAKFTVNEKAPEPTPEPKDGGCGGAVGGASVAAGALTLCLCAVALCAKKRAKE